MTGIVLASAFLLGILVRDAGAGTIALPLLAVTAVLVVVFPRRQSRLVVAALALIVLGFLRATPAPAVTSLPAVVGEASVFHGVVVDPPRRFPDNTRATLQLDQPAAATVAARFPPSFDVRQGDVVRVDGRIDGRDEDAPATLWISAAAVERNEASPLERVRSRLADTIGNPVRRNVTAPAGDLVLGVMTGDDNGMTPPVRDAFRAAGLSHLTAVSGWNVALVAGLFATIGAGRLPLRLWIAGSLVGIWLFAFLVGMEPSVRRAALMGSLYLVARLLGRPGDVLTALAITTAAILATTPLLRFDIGFQLSVAATFGIVLGLPHLVGRPMAVQVVAVPFVAEVAVAPLLLYHFGSYTLLGPLANLVVAPVIPSLMFGGILVVLASFASPLLAAVVGGLTWLPARFVVLVAEQTASIDWASGLMPELPWTWLVATYSAFIIGWCGLEWRRMASRRGVLPRATETAGGV